MSLGRGLSALITPSASFQKNGPKEKLDNQRIWHVPVSDIFPNPKQPRQSFPAEEMAELAESIKKHGVLQPLLVDEKANGGYELIAGELLNRPVLALCP